MFPPLRLRSALTMGGLSVKEMLARTWREMNEHEIWTRASAVAFYAMLAVVPFLGLVLLVAVRLLPDLTGGAAGSDATVGQLETTLRSLFPEDAYKLVEDQIVRIQKEPPFALLSVGLLIAIWSSSTLFLTIIDSMNRIAGVKESRSFVRLRLVAIAMTLIQAAILIGALLLIAGWPAILRWLGVSAPAALILTAIRWVVVAAMVLISFALAFFVGPDAEQSWEWITPGSLVGTLGFILGSVGFRFYIEKFTHYDKAYGSLGGVMVLLFWFWISAVVLLAGAQMNKVIEDASPLGKNYGQKIDTTVALDLAHAEPVAQSDANPPGA